MTEGQGTKFGSWGVDLGARNESVAPGEDFFQYANGKWVDEFELPADKPRFGAFEQLIELAQDQVRDILEELAGDDGGLDGGDRKLGQLYRDFMNTDRIEEVGLGPFAARLARIRELSDRTELWRAFASANAEMTYAAVGWSIDADPKTPKRQILTVSYGDLSLPDRDYYLEDLGQFRQAREAYLTHLQAVLSHLPEFSSDPAGDAKKILELETRMARVHWPRSVLRDVDKTYNPMLLDSLKEAYPSVSWDDYFATAGITDLHLCNVFAPGPLTEIIQIVDDSDLRDWRLLLVYRMLSVARDALPVVLERLMFEFYDRQLQGQPEPVPRWRRAVSFVNRSMGEAVGKHYVARHFPPDSKAKIDDLVSNLRAVFAERIDSSPWMTATTKRKALRKLASFDAKIGYPQQWKDYTELKLSSDDLLQDMLAVRRFEVQEKIAGLSKPTDTERWFMPPQTVNAYYHPLFNQIVFPAAILQPPFFDPNADPAVNYGGIGAVIGHEMGHGFDDQGRKFNEHGEIDNWWTETDSNQYREQTTKLVEQFNNYERLPGACVDGNLTLGENIGDLGGITLAYNAYRRSLGNAEAGLMNELTGDQRFFLGYAQLWRTKERDEFAMMLLKSDPHSPAIFRVNGALRNIDAWYDAFGIGEESPWYLPPDERARIW